MTIAQTLLVYRVRPELWKSLKGSHYGLLRGISAH